MDKATRAQHAEHIMNDEVLQEGFTVAYQRQCDIFTHKLATKKEVLEARRMALAIREVQSQMRSFITEGKIIEKRNQDRAND